MPVGIDVVASGPDRALDPADRRCRGLVLVDCTACGNVAGPDEHRVGARGRVKVQVGPVVVAVPSLTVTYHSNFWPAPMFAHEVVVLVPEATPVFWAIWVKLPLANGRPKKVTVIGLASGSDTPTLSVGEVPIAGGAVGRAVERRGVGGTGRGRKRRDLRGREGRRIDACVVEQAARNCTSAVVLRTKAKRQAVGPDRVAWSGDGTLLDAVDVQPDRGAVIRGRDVHPGRVVEWVVCRSS